MDRSSRCKESAVTTDHVIRRRSSQLLNITEEGTVGLFQPSRTFNSQLQKYDHQARQYKRMKGNSQPMTCLGRYRRAMKVQLQPFRNPALEGYGWIAPRSGHFTLEKDPLPIIQEAEQASGTVCTARKMLPPPESIHGPSSPMRVFIVSALSWSLEYLTVLLSAILDVSSN